MAKEKSRRVSFQRQIMEAGFGEMLQDFGFVKQSSTHYRRETERIIWDQVTLPHTLSKPEPRAFRDVLGYTINGFEEIYQDFVRRVDRKGWYENSYLDRIPGTKLDCHGDYCVIQLRGRKQTDPPDYWDPQPPKGFFKSLLWTPPRTVPKFCDRHPDAIYGHSYVYWQVREARDLRDFTDELCRYWVEAVWSEMQLDESPTDFIRGQRKRLIGPAINVRKSILLWMHGYRDLVLSAIDEALSLEEDTYQSTEKFFQDRGTFESNTVYNDPKRRDKLIRLALERDRENDQNAKALRETLLSRS